MNEKLTVWHGTTNKDIELFYPLSHFGTIDSAMARVENKDSIFYKCEINPKGFISIQDYGNETDCFPKDLLIQKILTYEEYIKLPLSLYKKDISQWRSIFQNILLSKNIHGFKYVNVAESSGDTSYIVVNPHMIDIIYKCTNPSI